jgi:paraquat-inducible protein B
MSKPANKKVIGLFVLGAIALLVVALVVFGSGKIFKKTVPMVFYFEGSVKGLNIGSAVVLKGVQVGSVTNVVLQFNPKDLSLRIPVYADFDPDKIARVTGERIVKRGEQVAMQKRLIDHGMRAKLEMQSILTGLLMINLDFLPDTPAKLVGTDPDVWEIPTVPTPLEVLTEKVQKLPIEETFNKLANAVSGIEKMVNSPELERGMKNLSQSAEEMRKTIKSINEEIKPLSASIQETLKDTRSVLKNADNQITGTATRLEGLMGEAQKLVSEVNGEVGPMASDLKKTLEEARGAIAQAQKTLQAAEGNYAEGSAFYYELTEALSGLNDASRSISLLGEYLKRHPDAVLWGKGTRR